MAKSRTNLAKWSQNAAQSIASSDNSLPTALIAAFFAQMGTDNVMQRERVYDRYKHSFSLLTKDVEAGIVRFDTDLLLYAQWDYLTRNMTLCNLYIGVHIKSEPSHYVCMARTEKGWRITSDRITAVPPGVFTPTRPGIFASWGEYTPTPAKALRLEPRFDVVFTGSERALSGYANEAIHDYEVRRQLSFAALQQAAIGTAEPSIVHTYHNPGRVTFTCDWNENTDGITSPYTFRCKVIRPGALMGQSKYRVSFTTDTDHNSTFDTYPDGRLLLPVLRDGEGGFVRNAAFNAAADAIVGSLLLPFVGFTENRQTGVYGARYEVGKVGILSIAEYVAPRAVRYAKQLPCLSPDPDSKHLVPNATFLHHMRAALCDPSPNERLKLWRRNLLVTQAVREVKGFEGVQTVDAMVEALEKVGFPLSAEDKEKL